MTRVWTILPLTTLMVAPTALAETHGLRGALESAPGLTSDPYDEDLLGGPLFGPAPAPQHLAPELEPRQEYSTVIEPTQQVASPVTPEVKQVRYVVSEQIEPAHQPTRVEGLLTWQGRTF